MRFPCRQGIILLFLLAVACSNPPETVAPTATRVSVTKTATARIMMQAADSTSTPGEQIIVDTPTAIVKQETEVLPTTTPEFLSWQDKPSISSETAKNLSVLANIAFSPWDLVTALSWHPDGNLMAIAAGDKIYIYQTSDQARLAGLDVGAFSHSVAFSPDGALLAAGSRDGRVRVWTLADLEQSDERSTPAVTIEAHKKGVNSVAFNQDGTMFASGGNDAVARFWDPANGEQVGMVIGGTFAVPTLAFSPIESVLAVVNGNVVRLRDAGSESILGTFLAEDSLFSLAYHPEGRLLAAGGVDNLIRLWIPEQAFRTGVETYPTPSLLEGHSGDPGSYRALIWQVRFSPDGAVLASAGGDGSVRLWNPTTADQLISLEAHQASVTCLDFSPNGGLLASGGLDGMVFIWGYAQE